MVSSPKKEVIGKIIKSQKAEIFYMSAWEKDKFLDCEEIYDEGATKKLVEETLSYTEGSVLFNDIGTTE